MTQQGTLSNMPSQVKDNIHTMDAYLDKIPYEYISEKDRETLRAAFNSCDIPTIQSQLNTIDRKIDDVSVNPYNSVAAAALAVMQDCTDMAIAYLTKDAHRVLNTILVMAGQNADPKLTIAILTICSCIEKRALQQAFTRTANLYLKITGYMPGNDQHDYLANLDEKTRDVIELKLRNVRDMLLLLPRT